MIELSNKIFLFFDKDFKKRVIIFLAIPLLISVLYYIDFCFLKEINIKDRISYIELITVSASAGGTSVRENKRVGYKYHTIKGYHFSTERKRLENHEVHLKITPIFNTVKVVITPNQRIKISSGFNGANQILLIVCNIMILVSISYLLIVDEITQNARLNLIFSNLFMFLIWLYVVITFEF